MISAAEEAAMRQAISLSALGLGATSPNPPVGCVILDENGQIVGQGYHRRKSAPHAEADALADAGERARCGTAAVTLEPCNHHGRTPPCHQALIDAGIRRVLVALLDPTSRGAGGVARLREAGIVVHVGVLGTEARLILGPWLEALSSGLPQIVWPHVVSGDDRCGLAAVPEESDLRRVADVVLTPHGSVEEAVPGTHLPGILDLSDLSPHLTPTEMASALYQAGIRTVLLDGTPDEAAGFLDAGLIQRVLAYVPEPRVSKSEPRNAQPLPFGGYRLEAFRRTEGFLCAEAVYAKTAPDRPARSSWSPNRTPRSRSATTTSPVSSS